MKRSLRTARTLACAAVVLGAVWTCGRAGGGSARRGHVRVAAAADLEPAMTELVARFGAAHAVDVGVSYGSSGTFYAQLLNHAPFDLFFSADIGYPRQLAARGLTVPGSEFEYAVGRLVVWAPAGSPIDVEAGGLQALLAPAAAHVSIANPAHAPYGRAAVAAMEAEHVYDRVKPKLVYGEDVAQAMQFVQSGAADIGIVPLSLALAPAVRNTGRRADVPLDDYPRLDQGGAILAWAADLDAARAFRAFVLGGEGRAILAQYGFSLPDGGAQGF